MTDLQVKFLALVKKKESAAKLLGLINSELADTMRQIPLGEMFQDPTDLVVYQIMTPSGTYIEYKNVDYIRTRKEGETRGTLSMKEAEAAGFTVPK
jgi:hypothetical protein